MLLVLGRGMRQSLARLGRLRLVWALPEQPRAQLAPPQRELLGLALLGLALLGLALLASSLGQTLIRQTSPKARQLKSSSSWVGS